jgi:hypothetical protein
MSSNVAVARFGGVGGPQELPEGEGGGGSGGGRIPFPGEINELPISRLVAELSSLSSRFAQLEKNLTGQLGAITQRLDALKR